MKKLILIFASTLFTVFGIAKVASAGPVVIDGTDANEHGQLYNGANELGWEYMQSVLEVLSQDVYTGTARTVVDLGTTPASCPTIGHDARDAIDSAFNLSALPGNGWNLIHVDTAVSITEWLQNLSPDNTGILYIPTYNSLCGDLQQDEMDAINANAQAIVAYVNGPGDPTKGGALFAMGERNAEICPSPKVDSAPASISTIPPPDYNVCLSSGPATTNAFVWLQSLIPGFSAAGFSTGYTTTLSLTVVGNSVFPGLMNTDISAGPWHNWFEGNFGSLSVIATGTEVYGCSDDTSCPQRAVILGGDTGTEFGSGSGQVSAIKTGSLLTDTDKSGTISPGDALQYQVHIHNATGYNVGDVVFNDTPDPNTTLIAGSVQATTGVIALGNTPGDTSVRVEIGTMTPGQSVDVLYDTAIADPFPAGIVTITNQGLVSSTHGVISTTNPINPGPTVITVTQTTEGEPALDLTAATDVGQCVLPGSSYLVTWTMQNVGDVAFPGGEIGTVVTGYASSPMSVTIPSIPAGTSGTITQSILVSEPIPYGAETITLTGNILTSTAVLPTQICAPVFTSTSTVGYQFIFTGESLTYTWQISNTGNAAAPGVTGVLTLPVLSLFSYADNLTSTFGTPAYDPISSTITWTGDLGISKTVTITFNARTSFGFPPELIKAPFEVDHPYRPQLVGISQYTYPYKLFFMLVLKDSSPSSSSAR
jgi:uncharacterized repeat protein (TIGR01451 family)